MEFPFGVAFTAGALAVFNPCALAMIPAYVAVRAQTEARATGALFATSAAGLVVGFVGVFTVVGVVLSFAGHALFQFAPFVAGGVGIVLVAIGVRTLAGRPLHISLPAVAVRGGAETLSAQVLFGATYGLASLGCALPVFLAYTASAIALSPAVLLAHLAAFSAGAAAALVGVVTVALGAREAELRVPDGGAIARYGGGTLIAAGGLYVAYLQLGWLVGYPLGVPALILSF